MHDVRRELINHVSGTFHHTWIDEPEWEVGRWLVFHCLVLDRDQVSARGARLPADRQTRVVRLSTELALVGVARG